MVDGTKLVIRDIINTIKIKGTTNPSYLLYLLEKLFLIIPDAYPVEDETELQDAIDAIGDGAGTIFMAGDTINITSTININGGGSYVIYGHGNNTILKPDDGINVFNVTDSVSVLFRTFSIDTTNYTADTQAFLINETNNNLIGFEDISITGGGTNGIGIEIQSDNCIINSCNILSMKTGIYVNNADKTVITNSLLFGNANYGIHLNLGDYSNITGNSCINNTLYGIYLYDSDHVIMSNNGCNSNSDTGIYLSSANYNTLTSNGCTSNLKNGIYITLGSYNTISSNTLNNNDSNTANPQAGLYVTTNSDFNTISANTVNNNNNAGAGNTYGILIATNDCNENVISGNNANGNDIDYEDEGTDTTVVYYVQTPDELQDAIDSIGSGTGKIIITSGTISITSSIDVDGGGAYIIQGQGINTILKPSTDDISAFHITNAKSCTISDLKVDISNYTGTGITNAGIWIAETSNNQCIMERITIIGNGTSSESGIYTTSNNNIIRNCNVNTLSSGIVIAGDYISIESNFSYDCTTNGIFVNGNYNNFSGNIAYNNNHGLRIEGDNNGCTGNISYNNTGNGIYILNSDKNTITGNTCYGNNNGLFITGDHNTISGNNFSGNASNIYISASNYIDISGNNCSLSSNIGWGIQLSASNNCVISGNICSAIVASSISNGGGILLSTNSSYNSILTNQCSNNSNTGAGVCYGILINVGSNYNVVNNNTVFGNDYNILDNGSSNQIEYLCVTDQEMQDAIDSIGTKSGTIIINSSFTVDTTIDIDGNGSYIIQGQGSDSTLTTGDNTCFNITSARSILFQNFKIDASALTGRNTEIFKINEASNNLIILDNIFITGTVAKGWGAEIDSNNVQIKNCHFENIDMGLYVYGDYCKIESSTFTGMDEYGIRISGDYATVSNNVCTTNGTGIMVTSTGTSYCNLSNNNCSNNTDYGIWIFTLDNINITDNTITGNDSGIKVEDSNYCNITNNTSSSNTTSGIVITGDSDNNYITGNTCNSNAGGYGIIIGAATCDYNIVKSNNCSGNLHDIWDLGTNTQIIYICSTQTQLQDAIDSIAAKSGTIQLINGIIDITSRIDIDGGGMYIIEGSGDNSTLNVDINNDRGIYITSALTGTILRNFKVDGTDYSPNVLANTWLIEINEGSDNKITIDNITVFGASATPRIIGIFSDNVTIKNNLIHDIGRAIYGTSSYSSFIGNIIYDCTIGMYMKGTENTILYNIFYSNTSGIYILNDYNTISNNIFYNNSGVGIYVNNSHNTLISSNNCNTNGIGIQGRDISYSIIIGNICNSNTNTGIFLDRATGTSCIYNVVTGNTCISNTTNGIWVDVNANNNTIGVNLLYNNGTNLLNNGTDTIIFGDDTVFGASWNGNLGTATKNTLYDKLTSLVEADITDLGSYLENVVEDTTPQLGGDLDLNNKKLNSFGWDSGDPNGQHFGQADMTLNGAWHELDLDNYITVPDNAIAVYMKVLIQDNVANSYLTFRSTSQSNEWQNVYIITQVANQNVTQSVIIPLDSNHKFDYKGTNGLNAVIAVVLGWIY